MSDITELQESVKSLQDSMTSLIETTLAHEEQLARLQEISQGLNDTMLGQDGRLEALVRDMEDHVQARKLPRQDGR